MAQERSQYEIGSQATAAGVQIEDQVFPKRCGHMEGKRVIPAGEMAGKVRAMADVRGRLGDDIGDDLPPERPRSRPAPLRCRIESLEFIKRNR